MIYSRSRWYDAQQGRFISEDQIRQQGGLNLYAYVNNSPLTWTDSFGFSGKGHHYVPGQVQRDNIPPGPARDVFEKATTGGPSGNGPLPRDVHSWCPAHQDYNNAVQGLLDEFIANNNIDPSKMTAEQANQFLEKVINSEEPAIRNFNRQIHEYIRGTGRVPGRGLSPSLMRSLPGAINALALADGLLIDLEDYMKAVECGRTFDEQMKIKWRRAGPYMMTPFGVMPNPEWHGGVELDT